MRFEVGASITPHFVTRYKMPYSPVKSRFKNVTAIGYNFVTNSKSSKKGINFVTK
jgi:hypothetical protein